MSAHNICLHGQISLPLSCIQLAFKNTSHMGPLIFAVVSSLYGILLGNAICFAKLLYALLIKEDNHYIHDFCDLAHETHFACCCRKITKIL